MLLGYLPKDPDKSPSKRLRHIRMHLEFKVRGGSSKGSGVKGTTGTVDG